jgi:hypothetical protein
MFITRVVIGVLCSLPLVRDKGKENCYQIPVSATRLLINAYYRATRFGANCRYLSPLRAARRCAYAGIPRRV